MKIMLSKEDETLQEKLVEIAKEGKTISCTELCNKAKLNLDMSVPRDRGALGNMLGRISHYEHQNGRPMLSAIVMGDKQNVPSKGFLITAAELGCNTKDKMVCWSKEMNRVHEYWHNITRK